MSEIVPTGPLPPAFVGVGTIVDGEHARRCDVENDAPTSVSRAPEEEETEEASRDLPPWRRPIRVSTRFSELSVEHRVRSEVAPLEG